MSLMIGICSTNKVGWEWGQGERDGLLGVAAAEVPSGRHLVCLCEGESNALLAARLLFRKNKYMVRSRQWPVDKVRLQGRVSIDACAFTLIREISNIQVCPKRPLCPSET